MPEKKSDLLSGGKPFILTQGDLFGSTKVEV